MVSNHLESTLSNPVRNNRAQKYFFSSERASVSSSFCGKNGLPLFHVRKAEWEQFPVYKKLRVCRQEINFLSTNS
ncbi:hypothetical protein DWW88_16650 [Bacteroides cellulosilyticus]|uniref:Uncharacterized protein n=1 Tax=Bacteroides cellulosilyticus TaxID=246787 RepID=A0A412RNB2_9BACE|nr:hypothetical protein F2Y86_06485 [Bacteroides cellulosilyticus]KAA5412047.1 hypothetical protein F2Y81_27140 [Bacteroides cellulosilyticus]KAA5422489.1 hypothetical protein F2Y87_01870 [Bacteroides cellulosilyticus]KAA5426868.1 hypothetical protein F2Y70_07250 [Bacteroides cellulosilyticus]KAA5434255.1 hypothetical protein F2Y83_15415 [Bacteroides cellulosilyticus]